MSAVIQIIEPIKGIKYIAAKEKWDSKEATVAAKELTDEEWDKKYLGHYELNGNKLNEKLGTIYLNRSYKYYTKRTNKDLLKLKNKFNEYVVRVEDHSYIEDTLVGTETIWRQGWWFKNKLFKNKCAIYYATDREHMNKLLTMFIDAKKAARRNQTVALIRQECNDAFHDGCIFTLAF